MSDKTNLELIDNHREAIDALDQQIVALLNERAVHSLKIRELKPGANMGLYDPRREEEIMRKICARNEGPLYSEHLREVYAAILKVMKDAPSA